MPARIQKSEINRGKPRETAGLPTMLDAIIFELRKLSAITISFGAEVADKLGLGQTDLQIVHLVQFYAPVTPKQLGKWVGLSSGGVSLALDRLEKAGYVKRRRNPEDGRSVLVFPVAAATRKAARFYADVENGTRERLGKLPESDHAAVLRFFEALHSVWR